jgi:hypothetical protein
LGTDCICADTVRMFCFTFAGRRGDGTIGMTDMRRMKCAAHEARLYADVQTRRTNDAEGVP